MNPILIIYAHRVGRLIINSSKQGVFFWTPSYLEPRVHGWEGGGGPVEHDGPLTMIP